MKFIGLLMVADEDDILERTLDLNTPFVDAFYVLDGSHSEVALNLCDSHPKCGGYIEDAWVEDASVVDGSRQYLLEEALERHGTDNWFVLLHGDEVWTVDPRDVVSDEFDGYVFNLPFFFPREGEPWDDAAHPLDQLHWSLGPGWPELRLFRGGPDVRYLPQQHFNVTPEGLRNIRFTGETILHYPYRSPDVQRARAGRHLATGFDPDNYRHIIDGDHVYWTDDMIAEKQLRPEFAELRDMVAA